MLRSTQISYDLYFYLLHNHFHSVHAFFIFVNFHSDIMLACMDYPEQCISVSPVKNVFWLYLCPLLSGCPFLLLLFPLNPLPVVFFTPIRFHQVVCLYERQDLKKAFLFRVIFILSVLTLLQKMYSSPHYSNIYQHVYSGRQGNSLVLPLFWHRIHTAHLVEFLCG